MAEHNELGKIGEDLAEKHLRRIGYRILHRNWHYGHDEIDIIARDGDWLVIVEVKTRTTNLFGEPEMEVKPAKMKAIVRTAEAYILAADFKGETRFDVIGILLGDGKVVLKHIKDAFMARM
ncbi:MAG: YraN family protein [Bacteroidota bacterium]